MMAASETIPGLRYERLEYGQIRLLKLRPGQRSGEPVIADIVSFFLEESPEYGALSYAWGDRKTCHHRSQYRAIAFKEDGQIRVPVNIFLALKWLLKWLQEEESERWLWIDQICINQKKKPDEEQREPTQEEQEATEEREAQVRMMGEIYTKAKTVYMHFGITAAKYDAKSMEQVKSWVKSDDELSLESPVYRTVYRMGFEEYFKRTWTIQEVVRKKEVMVLFKDALLPWSRLLSALANAPDILESDLSLFRKRPIMAVTNLFNGGGSPGLLDLLWASAGSEATDKRDKIYALLGLIEEDKKRDYPVKYGPWTTAAAFAHYTFRFCLESKSLDPLETSRQTATTSIEQLPTWAIDFSCLPTHGLKGGPQKITISPAWDKMRFCAHGGRSLPIHEMSLDQDFALNIRGCKVGEVKSLAAIQVPWRGAIDFSGCFKYLTETANPFAEWDSLTSFLVAFICTLLCDPGDPESDTEKLARENVKGLKMENGEEFELLEQRLVKHFKASYPVLEPANKRMYELCRTNSLFVTNNHNPLMGMGSGEALPGDTVCVFEGGRTPFILRKASTTMNEYQLVGECYVYGIMQGEWMRDVKEDNLEWFRLV